MGISGNGSSNIRNNPNGKYINPTYRCLDCGRDIIEYKGFTIDGLRCPRCQGPIVPIRTSEGIEARKDGLTEQEGKVMDALIAAWNEFLRLDITHPSDMPDFTNGIHQCQQILGMRVLQRNYPEGYPVKR